jgi:hypothetical protein
LRVVYDFTVVDDRITGIDLIADPARLATLDLVILDETGRVG